MVVNQFPSYIKNRVKRDDYRGIHLSQHNRLPFDKVLNILNIVNKFASTNQFNVHVGDWSGATQPGCEIYYKIVDNLKNILGQSTRNSLKKNIFPDLDTMGFLRRYNTSGGVILRNKREPVKSVELTQQSTKFIGEKNPRLQYKMYVEAVELLLTPILDELFLLLYAEFESMSVYEYMLIVSDTNINTTDKINLIKDYRRLKKIQQIKVKQEIENAFAAINKCAKDKNEKRDFMNWYNESLQIFNLLNQTIYFKTFGKTTLMLSISQEVFEMLAKRSQKQKDLYFKWHNVDRAEGYHLHHIYSLSNSTTKKDMKIVDDHRNLVYLREAVHKRIHHTNNLFVSLVIRNKKTILCNPMNPKEFIDITNDIIINKNNLQKMIDYNRKLLTTVT